MSLSKEQILLEYAKCVKDTPYALKTYLQTYDNTQSKYVPLELFNDQVTFTADTLNAGIGASIEWFVGPVGIETSQGTGSVFGPLTLLNGDNVYAVLTATNVCQVTPAPSNSIPFVVDSNTPSVGVNSDLIEQFCNFLFMYCIMCHFFLSKLFFLLIKNKNQLAFF